MKEILKDVTRVPNDRFKGAMSKTAYWKARPGVSGSWEGPVVDEYAEEQPYIDVDITENGKGATLAAVKVTGNVKDYIIETKSSSADMMVPRRPPVGASGTKRVFFSGGVQENFVEPLKKTRVVRYAFVSAKEKGAKKYKLKVKVWICEKKGKSLRFVQVSPPLSNVTELYIQWELSSGGLGS
jgi:hypothetical protein